MRFLLHTTPSPAEDLALEEAIHTCVEDGLSPNTWRVWQAAAPAVVLGTGQEAAKEVDLNAARAEQVPVLRRHSGGGAVLIGPGVVSYSAFYLLKDLPGSETIRGAMSAALRPVLQVLRTWGLQTCEAGLSDVAVAGGDGGLRKIAGNAQARKKKSAVVHGTLLADPDWGRIARLLRPPSSAPDYRAGRDHRAFLTSLREAGVPHELQPFADALARALQPAMPVEQAPSAEEQQRAARLLEEKYAQQEWNLRR
ncbi:MAG: biotin/lipoate A/B protein ligase family protein [Planctomycetota bacterium]|nr:biotin/lipoate A/B protein ligase family protein [Planctomycetota bacterium]